MKMPWSARPDPPASPPPESEQLPESALERLSRLEAAFVSLQADWDETLDKISRHFARSSARQRQRLHKDMETVAEGMTAQDDPGATNGEGADTQVPPDRKKALRAAWAHRRR